MEEHSALTPQFEAEVRAAMQVQDPGEQEFLRDLKGQVLSGRAPRRASVRAFLAHPAWAAALALMMLLALSLVVIGPQRALAQVQRWLGYVPGVGYVEQDASLRVLREPVEQEREGVVMTVEQVVADPQRTTVLYRVEGLGPQHRPGSEGAPRCAGSPFLFVSDHLELAVTGGEGQGWQSGYRFRMTFPPIPAGQDQVAFMVPCLDDTRPGAAPENWVFELALQPAPPDFQPLQVIEIPTPSAPAAAPGTAFPVGEPADSPGLQTDPHGIRFQVEKLVELEDGYLLQGSLDWQETDFETAYINAYFMQVQDATGQTVLVEPAPAGSAGHNPTTGQMDTWAIRTGTKSLTGPLTLTVPAVLVEQQVDIPFDVDLGDSPEAGQTWSLNQTLLVEGREVQLKSASLAASPDGQAGTYGLSIEMYADPGLFGSVDVWDPNHQSAILSLSGGMDPDGNIHHRITYNDLPTGTLHLLVSRVRYPLSGPWSQTVDLPAGSAPAETVPPQPSACLTPERLAELQPGSPSALPEGLGGRILVSGPAMEEVHFPTLIQMDLDGANPVTVGSGGWADVSPDGERVVYSFSDGLHLYSQESDQNTLLPWALGTASSPVWSPDGEWIAFMRSGEGIYITRPDGSEMRKAASAGAATSLVGWLPDGHALLVYTPNAEGSLLQSLDVQTWVITDLFTTENRKGDFSRPSPDGSRVAYREHVFGRPGYGIYIANLDGSEKRLVAVLDHAALTTPVWSPDGRWLLLTALEARLDGAEVTNYLVQPDTCEVIPLTWIEDPVTGWSR